MYILYKIIFISNTLWIIASYYRTSAIIPVCFWYSLSNFPLLKWCADLHCSYIKYRAENICGDTFQIN